MKNVYRSLILSIVVGIQPVIHAATVITQLDENRILLLDDYDLTTDVPPTWMHEGSNPVPSPGLTGGLLPGSEHYHRMEWIFLNCRMGQRNNPSTVMYVPPQMTTNYIPPTPSVNYSANLMNTLDAAIYSPVFTNGIGTLYFEAINTMSAAPVELTVDIATNMLGGAVLSGTMTEANVDWQLGVFSTNLTATTINDFVRVIQKLDICKPVAFRIRRSSTTSGALDNFYACVDNIRVSPSAPAIVFENVSAVLDGGGGMSYVACDVSNAPGTGAPTDHTSREIQLWYRWRSPTVTQSWNTVAMVYEPPTGAGGDGEHWQSAAFPFAPEMSLDYYFVFSGTSVYQSPDYTEKDYPYVPETGARYPAVPFVQPPGDAVMVTVQFHAQGGDVSPATRNYIAWGFYDDEGGLPIPLRLGYTFDGWFEDAACSGDEITGSTQVLEAVTDLYAKWTVNTYVVRYNANGGTGGEPMDDSTFTYDVPGVLTPNTFERTGYGFAGWATNIPSSTVIYTDGASVLNLSPIRDSTNNLYAVWTPNTYTVSYSPQGGTVYPVSKTVTYDAIYGPLPTPALPGHNFGGWWTEPLAGGTQVLASTLMTRIGNHYLYARWTTATYTVTFNPQGGTVSPVSTNVIYNSTYLLPPDPVRSGFIFAGWFTATGGGGTQVTASTQVTITGPQTLYANWATNTDWYTTNTTAVTYILYNEEEMIGFSLLVNEGVTDFDGKTVALGADIALTVPWVPIGTNEAAVFLGVFDGRGKVLSGLTVSSGDHAGLFGILGDGGAVKNINLTGCTVNGGVNAGGLVGTNEGLVQNSQVLSGSVTGAQNAGGLVGSNGGTIQNGFSTATVTGTSRGGIAGQNVAGGVIQNGYWLDSTSTAAIGTDFGTSDDCYSFTGFPGTLNGTVFKTEVLSVALNAWVQAQNSAFYWWTEGTGASHPLLTQFSPSLLTQQLSEERILLFDDYYLTNNLPVPTWRHEGSTPVPTPTLTGGLLPGSEHYHRTGWALLNCRMGQRNNPTNCMCVPPQVATNFSANLMNIQTTAAIYSPIFEDGIGTLYFEAINVSSASSADLSIEIATNMTVGGVKMPLSGSMTNANVEWKYVRSITLNKTSIDDFVRVVENLDIRQPAAVCIRRASVTPGAPDNFYVCVDNIRVSFPPADIALSTPPVPFSFGHPSVNQGEGWAQCGIDNRPGPHATSYLSGTRTNVQMVSRWNYIPRATNPPPGWVTPWQTNTFTCVEVGDGMGNGEKWEGTFLQYPEVGSLEYYFIGAFNGTRYQSPDYTERGWTYLPENPSPQVYAAAITTNAVTGAFSMAVPFRSDVRRYPAVFTGVVAETDQFGTIDMYLSGEDEWQARVPVVGTAISNLTWYFRGTGEYLGNYEISPETVYWCNATGIRNGVLPYADICLRTNSMDAATNASVRFEVKVVPEDANYVFLTLSTAQTNFVASRGEYQNFNAWNVGDAGANQFTDAADKYPKTAYSQNFDTWPTNTFTVINNSFSIDHAPSINQPFLLPENNVGTIDWMASSFEYVVERTAELGPPDAPLSQAWRNEAVRLLGGNSYLGLGYIQGNDRQREVIRGLGTASFKARLSQQITPGAYNYNATVHTKHYTASNYLIQAEVKLDSLSPERPSFSLVAYYQSPFKFYEYRLTHVVDPYDIVDIGTLRTPIRDAIIQQDLIRWDNGLPTTLKTSIFTNLATTTGDMLANYVDTYQPQFQLYTAGASVQLRGRFASGLNEISVTDDSSSSSIKSGTFGVMSADCTMEVMSMRMRGTILGPNEDPSSSSQPVNMAETDWAASPLHSLAGSAIRSLVPTNHVQVLTGETINGPWISHGTYALTSFVYANIQAPIELAHSSGGLNSKSVRLQVLGTASHLPSSDVVVDGIEVTSWRGENTVQSGWAVTEGRLVTNAPSGGVNNRISAHLDGTQANLDIPQSVRSPQIMGVGTITFDYRSLTTNKTAIQIQYMTNLQPDDTLFTGWTPLTNIPCNNPDWTTVSIHFGTLAATNVYVRFLNDWYGGGAQSSTHSIIELDNITIWNNPTNSPNDWVAYNTKITNTETNRWWVDGVDGGRNAALNNNVSVDTMPDPQDMADPYIMSPKLLNGFGRLSFLARTYDPTNALVANTEIAVYATKDAWSPLLPDSAWEQVHVFTSITNAFYRPFDLLLTNINDYTMMKLVVEGVRSGLATAQRVCIDEIVVTEQIYAKFDISNVRLMLTDGPVWVATRQPLEGQDIGIEAQLTNMLFEPDDIRMHVTYVIGTNTWGVKQAPLMQQHTLDMDLVDPVNRTYRTRLPSALYSIPEQERNTVVQYLVWAQYASPDTGEMETAQKPDTFVNPEWYFPVDFNKQFEASGWSPYYIVYDVPPGAVWINEVNVYEPSGMTTWQANPYIEIAMPAWMSLGGWSIESLKGAWPDTSATNTIVFPLNVQPKSPYPEANGYAFFVVGPPWQNLPPPITESLPVVDFAVANLNTIMPRLEAGGLRLRRPLGMYEQAIVYDWMEGVGTISGQGWANADSQRRFKYIGYESSDGSLSFTGTVERTESAYVREDSTNTWSGIGLSNWTPGLPNIGQVMPDAPMPGGSNVLITSILSIAKGSHNDDRALTHLIKLRKNESTNIAYQADTWYRLYSIKENDTERLPLAPTNSYTLYVNNVQSNTQVYVTLDAREDAQGLAPDILDWLQGFDDLPFAPTYLNKLDSPQQLTLRECFWINANPTTTNVFTFLAHANDIHLRPLYLTLEMSIFSNLTETVKVTHLQGNSVVQPWASFTLSPVNWDMMLDQYTVTPTSFDMNNKSRVHINAFTNRPAFFKWTLGLEDSRSATHEMENIPKP